MKNTADIYNMSMHENIEIENNIDVTRVPGGWIYTKWTSLYDSKQGMSTVFVPMKLESAPVKTSIFQMLIDIVIRWKLSVWPKSIAI